MSSISVIVPSWHYWAEPLKLQPLWELYYATHLRRSIPNAEVDIIDLREAAARAPGFVIPQRDIYVYWVMKSADSREIYDIVRTLKALYPASVHIGGGTHVDFVTEESAGVFDAVVLGTAEDILPEAVRDARAGRLEKIYRSPLKPPFSDYGHTERDFLSPDRIVNDRHFEKYGGVVGTGAYFSRGCNFRCNFCVYNNPNKFEWRTPAQITAEIEYLQREYGVQGVNLRDEVCLPPHPKTAIDYIEAIGRTGVIWRGQTIPMGTEEIVKLAAESGLQEVALGLESVDSDDVLVMANKPSKSIENNKRYIELLKKYGIKVKVCLIFGLPGESRQVLDRTIRFLDETQPDYVAVSGFDPVPGSPFFRNAAQYGIKNIDTDLSKHAHLLFRFGDEEDVGLPFEYETVTPWGESLPREAIVENIKAIQSYLRERGMSY